MTDNSNDAPVSQTVPQTDSDAADSWDQALAAAFAAQSEPPVAVGHSVLAALSEYFGRMPQVTLRRPDANVVHSLREWPPSGEADPLAERVDHTGRFHLYGEIGRGGMGAIYFGRDTDLGRDLAVKVLLESHQHKPDLGRRFLYEAQVAGQLEHPAIPPVYELGRLSDGRPFFAMKLVRGKTFAALLAERKSPADDLPRHLDILTQVCQAMAYAHSRGVIHRDLKPSNIMVGAFGEVQLMDWGLAKVLPQGGVADDRQHAASDATVAWSPDDAHRDTDRFEDSKTRAGSIVGTPAYMSPEQARGEVDALNERSDVFSLGAILCEILTGKPPYSGTDISAVRDLASKGEQADARKRLADCAADKELVSLAEACLALSPADRPRTAAEVAERLTGYRQSVEKRLHDAELATAAAQAKAVEERRRRRLSLALSLVLIAIAAFAAAGGTWWYQQRQQMIRDVESDLAEAASHRKAERWEDARAAIQRAQGRIGSGGPALLRQNVGQALKDAQMVAALDEIREAQSALKAESGSWDLWGVNERYANAFRNYGVDVAASSVAEAASKIRQSAIQLKLVAAVDNWWFSGKRPTDQRVIKLRQIADAADDDSFRQSFRKARFSRDTAELLKLANHDDVLSQPVEELILVARALRDLGSRDAATSLLLKVQQRQPDDFWINEDLGLLVAPAEGIGFLRAAIAIRPDSPGAHVNLGSAFDELGKLEEAIAEYRSAIDLKPDYAEAYSNLGHALARHGKLDEAIAEHRRAIELKPGAAGFHSNLGFALSKQGKRDEAIAAFRHAIDLDPNYAMAYCNLGALLADQGMHSEEIDAYRRAIDLDPKLAMAHYNLGAALAQQGKLDEAIGAYHRAIALKPDYATPQYGLGIALAKQGKVEEAADAYRRAIQLRPNFAIFHDNLGALLARQGKLAEAVREFQAAIDSNPSFAQAHGNLGIALMRQGRMNDAMNAFSRAAELNPGDEIARYNAPCCAALLAAGNGNDAKDLTNDQRKELRRKCLAWLKDDLAARKKAAQEGDEKVKQAMAAHLAHALKDPDLASVRDAEALAKLPEEERAAWQALWEETEQVRKSLAP